MQVSNRFEEARESYRPGSIKYLFVAESPPEESSNRFFYFENVREQDSLFIEMMKLFYPQDTTDTPTIRRNKGIFLQRFMSDGFFLIDSVDVPITKRGQKYKIIREKLPELKRKLRTLAESETKIILISAPVYNVCRNLEGR